MAGNGLSTRQMEFLAATLKQLPKDAFSAVDFDKVVQETGFKNADSAKTTLRNIRKKLDEASSLPDESPKRKAPTDGGSTAGEGTPTKKSRTKKPASKGPKKAPKKASDGEDDGEQEQEPTEVKTEDFETV